MFFFFFYSTEVKRLGLVPINKQASEISQVRSGETDDAHASWRRRIVKVIRRQKKDKKPVVKKDLADIEFDEEVLKEVKYVRHCYIDLNANKTIHQKL